MSFQVSQCALNFLNTTVSFLSEGEAVSSTISSVAGAVFSASGASFILVGGVLLAGGYFLNRNRQIRQLAACKEAKEELLLKIQELGLEIEDEYVQKIITWCDEKYGTSEYRNRVVAAKKIMDCYALNDSKVLDLGGLQLTSLPELNLPGLERLNLSGNRLASLPEFNFPSLKELNLSGNRLASLPEFNLPSLERLYLQRNQLALLPELNLPSLEVLNLSSNQLTSLPELNLPSLWWLNLSHNRLASLPELDFPSLKELHLSGNRLTSLPELNLPHLGQLNLSHNRLASLPALNFPSLWWLNLPYNRLASLPELNCPSLRGLYLENNQFESLPELNFPSLGVLYLSHNLLASLPELNLPRLKDFRLSGNRFTSLPALNFPNLRVFNLSRNQLASLPQLNFPSLWRLNLSDNQLASLPELDFPGLKELQLSGNRFTSLPALNFPSLERLDLVHNPQLQDLPLSLTNSFLTHIDIDDTQIPQNRVDTILAVCRERRDKQALQVLPLLLKAWSDYAHRDSDRLQGVLSLSENDQMEIHEWLTRLSRTRDFRGHQEQLATIVCSMLENLSNDEFRELFIGQIRANNECCQDRAAMALNELYVGWKVLVPKEENSQVFELLAKAAKTLALRAILSKMPQMQNQNEGVEIYLYYETALSQRLGLLTAIQSMSYEQMGKRDWVDENALVQEVNSQYLDCLINIPLFDRLFVKDHEIATPFEEMQKPFYDELDKLSEQFSQDQINEHQYCQACEQCKQRLEKACVAFKKKWFLQKLAEKL